LGVGAIVALSACRQIVGIEDSPQTDIVTSVGGIEFGTATCAACAQKNCVAPATACSQSAPCEEYEDCLGTCKGDAECRSQCTADHRIGVGSTTELSKLSSCLASNCEADCNLGCGAVAAYVTPPASAAACETCLAADCDVENKCAQSVDCDAYVRCLVSCPTEDCQQACASTFDSGHMLYGEFDAARKSQCARLCAYGNDWSCVGHFSPPAPRSMSTTITFTRIYDRHTISTTMTPIPSANVTICGAVVSTDFSCNPPLVGPIPTDPNGDVTIPMVPIALSLDGEGLNGFGRVHADGYVDTYFFWGYPLSEPSVTWGPPFTPSLFLDPLPPPAAGSGNAWVVAFDCLGLQAGGVHIHLDTPTGPEPEYFMYPPNDAGTYPNVPNSGSPGIAEYTGLPAIVHKFYAYPEGSTQPSSVVIANVFDGTQSLVPLLPNQ
jgi:hypothetical protein